MSTKTDSIATSDDIKGWTDNGDGTVTVQFKDGTEGTFEFVPAGTPGAVPASDYTDDPAYADKWVNHDPIG